MCSTSRPSGACPGPGRALRAECLVANRRAQAQPLLPSSIWRVPERRRWGLVAIVCRTALSCRRDCRGAEGVVRECPPRVCKFEQSDGLAPGKMETWRETRLMRISGNGSELGMLRGEMAGSDPGPTHPGRAAGCRAVCDGGPGDWSRVQLQLPLAPFADTGLKWQPDQAGLAMQQGSASSLFCCVVGIASTVDCVPPTVVACRRRDLCKSRCRCWNALVCTCARLSTPHVVRVVAGTGGDPGNLPVHLPMLVISCGHGGNGDHPLINPGRWAENRATTQGLDGAGPAPRCSLLQDPGLSGAKHPQPEESTQ